MALPQRLALWGPAVLWAAVIFGLSSIPSLASGLGVWDEVLRKSAHLAEYAVLGLLLMRAWTRELPALTTAVAYAVTDEIHQRFVQGRHSSPFDVAFDACGAAIGVLLWQVFRSRGALDET